MKNVKPGVKRLTFPIATLGIVTGALIFTELQSCKHDPITLDRLDTTIVASPIPGSIPGVDGATLYANNCAGCHGPLATSAKLGATAANIQTGIANVNGMKPLSALSGTQIQAIAGVLKLTTTPAPVPTDGASLYALKCAGCHGALTTSAKIGASVSRIQNGISTVSGMKSLTSLTATQIQAISSALVSTPMPTDGASLYSINCASCHGVLASSQVGSSSVTKIQQAIKEKSKMNYLSVLSLGQVQAISGALAGIKGGD